MPPMRLIVARCEVTYSGRLNAFLPESTRLLMLKDDGSVLVHADAGGYKPLNWMTPPTVVEHDGDRIVVRKRAGRSEDRLEILLAEVLADVEHDMGEAAGLEKDGVERDLQEALAAQTLKPQAVTLAESRGIRCVAVDLAVLRGDREPELTLFA